MSTLPNCKGFYAKRSDCKKWIVKFPLGWSDELGKYEYYCESLDSEPEAILALKEINEYLYFGGVKTKKSIFAHRRKKQLEEIELKEESLVTLEEFALEFAQLRIEQNQVSKRTYNDYLTIIKRIHPYIGELPLVSITTRDIDNMYQTMKSTHNKNLGKKPLSGASLAKTHAVLNLVFNHAIDYDLISKNPLSKAQKPKVDTSEKQTLTEADAQALYNKLITPPYNSFEIGILIGLLCGTRISEMLALTWIDYKNETLTISKSLEKDSQISKCPKNGESRVVTCPDCLITILEKWKTQQQDYFTNNLHYPWSKKIAIVNARWGNHQTQSNFRRWMRNHADDYNFPDGFHYHMLRHTYVTFLFRDCGVDERTTRELSGHKSAAAFQGYTHTNTEWKRKATDKLNDIYASSVDTSTLTHICKNCSLWSASPTKDKGTCWLNSQIKITSSCDSCPNFKVN